MLLLLAGLADVIPLTPAVYRLSELLGKLEAGGVKYSCSSDIRDEVILVKASPQTPEKWRALLARAAGGKWDRSGSRWNLRSLDQSAIDRTSRDESLEKWVGPNFSSRLPGRRYPMPGETWGKQIDTSTQAEWAKVDARCSPYLKACVANRVSALMTVETGTSWTEAALRAFANDGSTTGALGEPEMMKDPVEVVDPRVLEDETWEKFSKADGSLPITDPFKFAEPVLLKYCSIVGGQYVLNLPDGLLTALPNGKPSVGKFRQALEYYGLPELSDGIWQSKLRLPQASRQQRVPVDALLTWSRKFKADPFPRLTDLGQFVDSVGDGFDLGMFESFYWAAVGVHPAWDRLGKSVTYGKLDQLRFFARMSSSALSDLREGRSVTVGDLPPAAQASLARLIFNRKVSSVTASKAIADGNYAGAFVKGDPVRWRVSAEIKRYPVVLAVDGPFRNIMFDARTAGYLVFRQDQDPTWRDQSGYPDLRRRKLLTGIREEWMFSLETPTFTHKFELKDSQVDAKRAPVSYRALPEDLMQEINRTIKEYEVKNSKIPPSK